MVGLFPTIDTPLKKVALFCVIVGVAGFLLMLFDDGLKWYGVLQLAVVLIFGWSALYRDDGARETREPGEAES